MRQPLWSLVLVTLSDANTRVYCTLPCVHGSFWLSNSVRQSSNDQRSPGPNHGQGGLAFVSDFGKTGRRAGWVRDGTLI